jgi:ATP-dependent helicase/nuclease subunit B
VGLWRNSQFEPTLLEATFGMKGGLPALEIDTPKGRRAVLRGKIDRIDVARMGGQAVLTVIDYKRSSRYKFRLDSAMAGLQVQLVAYMKAAAQAGAAGHFGDGSAVAGGMYYFNLLPTWEKVAPEEMLRTTTADKETGRQRDKEQQQGVDSKQWQLKGFTNTDWLGAFGDGQDGRWPMEMSLKKDGQPGARVPAGSTVELQKAMDHIWQEMATTVDRIVDGDFVINPYRMGQEVACNHCPFDGLCRFAPEFNKYREVERCGTRQLLDRLNGSG